MATNTRIAVIDDGINPHELQKGRIQGGINIGVIGDKIIHYGNGLTKKAESHGTICAAIIEHTAPDAEIISIRVCDQNTGCSLDVLVAAINWAMENDAQIINISLARKDIADPAPLITTCNRAFRKNIIIISSRLNRGGMNKSYPADLEHVISVKQKKTSIIDFKAELIKIKLEIAIDKKKIHKTIRVNRKYGNNSFMTAYVSGVIADMNHGAPPVNDLLFQKLAARIQGQSSEYFLKEGSQKFIKE